VSSAVVDPTLNLIPTRRYESQLSSRASDIARYTRSKDDYFRGIGLMTRLPELDY